MTPTSAPLLDRLATLLGWKGSADIEIDWPALTDAAGHAFPADYRRYAERFPPGAIGPMEVLHPLVWGGPDDFLAYARNWHDVMNDKTEVWESGSHHYGTSPGDLCMWGTIQADYLLCWHITEGSPDKWATAVCDTANGAPSDRYCGTATELLLALAEDGNPVPVIGYVTETALPFRFFRYE